MKKLLYIIAVTFVTAVTLTGCEYKELTELDDSSIRPKKKFLVDFDWTKVENIPPSMRVVFWSTDFVLNQSGFTVFDILNNETELELPVGTYNVTAWNNNTEYVVYGVHGNRNSTYATTGSYSPHGNAQIPKVLDSLYNGQKVLDYPDYMVHANEVDFQLVNDGKEQKLILNGDSMVVTVEVKLRGIAGQEWCQNIRGAINNIAGKRLMAFDNATDDAVTIMFDGQTHIADSTVTAKFYVFGKEPTNINSLPHKMVFFFWLPGGQVFIPMDVTNTMSKYSREDKYIYIESPELNIDLRKYMKGGGTGMVVDADDWQEGEEIPLDF